MPYKKSGMTCHYCGEPGHKASKCFNANPELREQSTIMVRGGEGMIIRVQSKGERKVELGLE